ncbi:MAG: 4-hydroxy-tetrahydrodipicolinate synthase [Clostridia bacterium]|nr:4-hydroxy-tetrahydrodipicolinate synthase [Clostridia bacterium]
MKQPLFSGVATALITPFKNDGALDITGLEQLIEFQIENGIHALVLAGTTGEGSTLTFEEFRSLIKNGVEFARGRVPVIAGTGSNNTEKAKLLSKEAQEQGADGLLMVTPYYNKTTQEGLVRHYTEILDSVSIPAILYNVPSRTGMTIEAKTALTLSRHPNVVGIKEASGNIGATAELIYTCPGLHVYSGNDDQTLPILSLGGAGVISVLSNVAPQETQRIYTLFEQGKNQKAAQLQLRLLPLIRALFSQVNPIPIKGAMAIQGLPGGEPRLPLVPCSSQVLTQIKNAIKEAGI